MRRLNRGFLVLLLFLFLGNLWAARLRSPSPESGADSQVTPTPTPEAPEEDPSPKSDESDPKSDDEEEDHAKQVRPRVIIGSDFETLPQTTVESVVVLFGNATINGPIEQDCVVLFGNLKLNNHVGGDVVTLFGKQEIGPKARIKGDLVMIGGSQDVDESARVKGDRVVMSLGDCSHELDFFWKWNREALFKGRPIAPGLWWNWMIVAAFGLLYVSLSALFPGTVAVGRQQLQSRPASAFVAGLAILILAVPLFFFLFITVLGAPVMFLLLLALLSGLVLGRTVVLSYLGQRLFSWNTPPPKLPLLLETLIGSVALVIALVIPIVGLLVWGATLVWGFGAVCLVVQESFRREKNPRPNPVISAVEPAATESAPRSVSAPILSPETSAPLATLGRRTGALLLDGLIVAIASDAVPRIPSTLLWIVYFTVMIGWKGTTLAGILLDLKCVRTDGRPLDWSTAAVRSVASLLSAVVFGIGYWWAFFDPRRQTWHDRIAGVEIVRSTKIQSLV